MTGINAEAHLRAIQRTQEAIPFPTRAKLVYVPGMTIEQYSVYMVKELHHDIETDFTLVCQADGYGLRPELWLAEFCDFDYCGAPFPNGEVGNGGLSLRSRRFIEASARFAPPEIAEDAYLCQYRKRDLQDAGIRLAPAEIGIRFSYEHPCGIPWNKTMSWGCHGRFNFE